VMSKEAMSGRQFVPPRGGPPRRRRRDDDFEGSRARRKDFVNNNERRVRTDNSNDTRQVGRLFHILGLIGQPVCDRQTDRGSCEGIVHHAVHSIAR